MNEFTIVPEWPGRAVPPSRWLDIHQSIERGEIVAIPLNGKTRFGFSSTLDNYAKKHGGYRLQTTVHDGCLYIRRVEAAQ